MLRRPSSSYASAAALAPAYWNAASARSWRVGWPRYCAQWKVGVSASLPVRKPTLYSIRPFPFESYLFSCPLTSHSAYLANCSMISRSPPCTLYAFQASRAMYCSYVLPQLCEPGLSMKASHFDVSPEATQLPYDHSGSLKYFRSCMCIGCVSWIALL